MVDMEKMERRNIDKINIAVGWYCPKCEAWNLFFKTTRSLDRAFEKLEGRKPDSTSYVYHFAKTMRKAEGVQE